MPSRSRRDKEYKSFDEYKRHFFGEPKSRKARDYLGDPYAFGVALAEKAVKTVESLLGNGEKSLPEAQQ